MSTTVVNKRKSEFDVYIGRGSLFGNPHPIGWCSTCRRSHDRNDCLRMYRHDFEYAIRDKKWRDEVEKLRDKVLGCFCKPQACHGDVIIEWLEKTGQFAPSDEVYTICCHGGCK